MAIYSKSTQNAVNMLAHIAQSGEEKFSTVRDVSIATGISEPTVAKMLQVLVKEGILGSKKGPGGGFYLTESPDAVTLERILRAVEGREPFFDYLAGLGSCHDENVCPLHEKWIIVRQVLDDFMESTTLREIALAVKKSRKVNVFFVSGGLRQ
jgi:Rrf2 family protein